MSRREWSWITGCVVLIGIFLILTIREGHNWGGDNCAYVFHAQNILSGNAYADTGYIYNPISARIPNTYPPVFPLVILPVVAVFGASWFALKVEVILFLTGALFLMALYFRSRMSLPYLITALLVVGFNPILWDFKDSVLSETTFIFFSIASLYLIQQIHQRNPSRSQQALFAIGIGALLYLSYGTRAVGVLIWGAWFLYEALRYRRISRTFWIALVVFVPLAMIQNQFFHSEAIHVGHKLSTFSWETLQKNAGRVYPFLFASFWYNRVSTLAMDVLTWTLTAFACTGLIHCFRTRRVEVLDLFFLIYLGFFLFIRVEDTTPVQRYLIPIFPIAVFYMFQGLQRLARLGAKHANDGLLVLVTMGLVIGATYGGHYMKFKPRVIQDSITSRSANEMYDFLKTETSAEDVMIFFEPRVITFYTGRRASQFDSYLNYPKMMQYAKTIAADYLILTGVERDQHQAKLDQVFRNEKFTIYRLET